MKTNAYSVGKGLQEWKGGIAQTITFIVTDDCNLRCKYCYVTHKCPDKQMSFDTAKKFVDFILTANINRSEAVVLEFIGGEPMLEAELIDAICDYFKIRAFELGSSWYWNYRISICTNGVNYSCEAVQNLIKKNRGKMSVSISLDGTKQKHDSQRVFPDGSGSYDTIIKNIDLWLSQFPGSTKMTFASDDLPYLKDSVISLWGKGIKKVAANVVFENVWKDGDDGIFEEQLKDLADYILDNHLFDQGYICTLFDDTIGSPYRGNDMYQTFCGAGKMLACSADGNIFPCLRYYSHSLNNHPEWPIGNVETGLEMDRIRPFITSNISVQSDAECLVCPIASGCGFCQGFNYDDAATPTNSHRAKYICKMHKARVRANNYYFSKLKNIYGIEREEAHTIDKQFNILLAEDYVTYCCFENEKTSNVKMPQDVLESSLKYADANFMQPVFIHSKTAPMLDLPEEYSKYDILHILPAHFYNLAKSKGLKSVTPVFNSSNIDCRIETVDNCILTVKQSEISKLAELSKRVLDISNRVNLFITSLNDNFDENEYEKQLMTIKTIIIDILSSDKIKEYNILTDLLFVDKHFNCRAGEKQLTVDATGAIWPCPAFLNVPSFEAIGTIYGDITRDYDSRLYQIKNNSICKECDAFQCANCVFTNLSHTGEVNVSPSFQCRKSHIERKVAQDLFLNVKDMDIIAQKKRITPFEPITYLDPIIRYLEKTGNEYGTYKLNI